MLTRAANWSWTGKTQGIRARIPLIGCIETALGPTLTVFTLVICSIWLGVDFGLQYVLLSLLAFLLLFPGILSLSESRTSMFGRSLSAWFAVCISLYVFGYVSGTLRYYDSRVVLAWVVLTPAVLFAGHEIARRIVYNVLSNSSRSAVIIGGNETGSMLAGYFRGNHYSGIEFKGFFDDRGRDRIGQMVGDLPMLGDLTNLADYVRANNIEQIYITLPMASQPRVIALLDALKDTTSSIFFVPDIFITDVIQGRVDMLEGIPVVAVCESPFAGVNGIVKRLEDIILASLILLLISPILLACAIAVRISSPGPIIFRQRRYGLDGQEIYVYKFRSMTTTDDGAVVRQATRNDARVTRVGAILRRTSLDELPQFINVLQGRMSIVGPRPHAVAHNEQYRKLIKGYMVRHKVRPGITGFAQINGARGETDTVDKMERRIQLDLYYLRNWSLALDLKIILRTVGLVAKDSAAY